MHRRSLQDSKLTITHISALRWFWRKIVFCALLWGEKWECTKCFVYFQTQLEPVIAIRWITLLTAFMHNPLLNSTSSHHTNSNMMKSHVFCNSAGVYMVCMCKLTEPDLSTSTPEHVTHKLQNEFFSQEAESWLASDKVSPVWTLLLMCTLATCKVLQVTKNCLKSIAGLKILI